MPNLTPFRWTLIVLLISCYLAICTRTAFRMAKTGRNFWLWLGITVFLTSIPGTFVLMRDQFRRLQPRRSRRRRSRAPDAEPLRCNHCGKATRSEDLDRSGGVAVCPHCGLPVDEGELA